MRVTVIEIIEQPTQPVVTPEKAVSTLWQVVKTIQRESSAELWYETNSADESIALLRDFLRPYLDSAMFTRKRESTVRDLGSLRFSYRAIDAIVNVASVDAVAIEHHQFQNTIAATLEYAATQTISELLNEYDTAWDDTERGYIKGLINELTPIGLLNRPVIVDTTQSVTVPGTFYQDTAQATDIKQVRIPSKQNLPIQIKSEWSNLARVPHFGIMVAADDFDNTKLGTSQLLASMQRGPVTSAMQREADRIALKLQRTIELRSTPEVQKRDRATRRDLTARTTHLTHRIMDDVPELQAYKDRQKKK